MIVLNLFYPTSRVLGVIFHVELRFMVPRPRAAAPGSKTTPESEHLSTKLITSAIMGFIPGTTIHGHT